MYDPVNNEPSQCATIRRNIEALSRQRANLRAEIRRDEAALGRLRRDAEAARNNLRLAKDRAKAGQDRNRRPAGRPSKWEALQQGAELVEAIAENFLRDWTRQARRADERVREQEVELAQLERRWEEADRLLLHNERLFEQTGCRGQSINHRVWG
jgi:chromosome segregation ATPase